MKLAHNPHFSSIGPRFIAGCIDATIPSIVTMYFLSQLVTITSLTRFLPALLQYVAYIAIPVSFIYSILILTLLTLTGYTPGKWVCGIQIKSTNKKPLGFAPILVREWIAKQVSAIAAMAGFWAIAFDDNHQGWHDQLAGSFAYRQNKSLYPAMLLWAILTAVLTYLVYLTVSNLLSNMSLIQDIVFIFEPLKNLRL